MNVGDPRAKPDDSGSEWRDITPPGTLRPKPPAPDPKPPGHLTVGKAWKFRRNLVIYVAGRHGVSQRVLADVFDLPHSRIAAIIKEFRTKYGDPEAGRVGRAGSSDARAIDGGKSTRAIN